MRPTLLLPLPLLLGCPGGEPVPVIPEDTQPAVDTGDSTPDTGPPPEEEVAIAPAWDGDDFYTVYDVGPGQDWASPCDLPWSELQGGTLVRIHHQDEPYRCKWAITTEAYENHPLVILGVPNEDGALPVISGDEAATPTEVALFQEDRWVLRVGGEEIADVATWVWIQDLVIEGARPEHGFTTDEGQADSYDPSAAAVRIEQAADVHLVGVELRDSNNGLLVTPDAERVELTASWLHDNGSASAVSTANLHAEARGLEVTYCRLGPLAEGVAAPNIADRSAGLVLSTSWIEGGDHQLALLASSDPRVLAHPDYGRVFVFGNTFVEPQGDGANQIVQLAGAGEGAVRESALSFYHNTVLSLRSDKTILVLLPEASQSAALWGNLVHATAGGSQLQLVSGEGSLVLHDTWLTEGYSQTSAGEAPQVQELDTTSGADPLFRDLEALDLHPDLGSPVQGLAGELDDSLADHPIEYQYMQHQRRAKREVVEDLGAFEG